MKSRRKRLAYNTGSSLIFQLTTIICGFILPRLILKTYGSEVNGLINSITQFLGIISFLELGVGAVIQSSLYKPLSEKNDSEISKIVVSGQKFFRKLAFILLIYILILIITYPVVAKQNLGFLYTATMIIVLSISSFAQYFFGIINSLLLTADQKGYISYYIQTFVLILNTVVCFALIRMGASIHIVKLSTALIYIMRPIVLSVYVRKKYNINWKIKYEKEPIKQKWNGVAQHVSAVVLDGTDNIVLTLFAGLKAVSIYSVYNIVTAGVKRLLLSMTNGFQALMGELWAKQEIKQLRSFFGWVEWTLHTGTTFIFGITSILIVPFISVYTYGINDVNYIQPLFAFLLVTANAGHCLRLPYNLMILAGGHYKQTQRNYIFAAGINIVVSVLAVKSFGLVGVTIGTVIAMCYQTFWMAYYDSKHLLKWPFKNFLKQISVDILFVVIMHCIIVVSPISIFFRLTEINYIAWIGLAIKVGILGVIIILVINMIFYKEYIYKIFRKCNLIK